MDAKYYTLAEIADRLQVSWRTVHRWIKRGELPAHKLGSDWRVAEEDMRKFLEERRNVR